MFPVTTEKSSNGGGLSGGEIAGIVIGVVAFVGLVGIGIACWIYRRRKRSASKFL